MAAAVSSGDSDGAEISADRGVGDVLRHRGQRGRQQVLEEPPDPAVPAQLRPAGPGAGDRDAAERLGLHRRDRADQQVVVGLGQVEDGDEGAPVVDVGPDRHAGPGRHP